MEVERPPQTSISEPVQTALLPTRPEGAPTVDVDDHESAAGSYRPPVEFAPPQTIIWLPVQTAGPPTAGAPANDIAVQEFVTGSYSPALVGVGGGLLPQISIRLLVQKGGRLVLEG